MSTMMWPEATDPQSEVDQLVDVCKEHGSVGSVLDLGGRHRESLAAAGFDPVDAAGTAPGQTFDAVVLLGSAFGRQPEEDALRSTVDTVRHHLRPGGLFLFDVLDGNAVLSRRSHNRFTRVTDGATQLVTATRGSVDTDESVLRLDLQRWRLSGGRVVTAARETLLIRFFLPRELDLVLRINGFRLLGTAPLAGGEAAPAYRWNRLAWARAGADTEA
ncbi:MAG TPA: hypothetical protein VGR06_42075 [Actinophytocola sp.]|jgi:hypothetical protein|uniref:hypothetical protein n=1 Tax=Actinophytocola sp. TaxID=1872138 RepID=UPI002E009162|nr:hypothetical protein [Actinophytocola sp.]